MSSHLLRYFDWILFIFAGNEDMHKNLDEFEIRPDLRPLLFMATDRVTVHNIFLSLYTATRPRGHSRQVNKSSNFDQIMDMHNI